MIDLSPDPYVAEQQMRAVIFCLVAFGYIDSDFAATEREVVRRQLYDCAQHRASSRSLATDGHPRAAHQWEAHYQSIVAQYDDIIQGHFTESVAEGETTQQWIVAKLKVGCFEVLRHFDKVGQRSILTAVEEVMLADGVEHPEERAFRDELLDLIERAPISTEPISTEEGSQDPATLVNANTQTGAHDEAVDSTAATPYAGVPAAQVANTEMPPAPGADGNLVNADTVSFSSSTTIPTVRPGHSPVTLHAPVAMPLQEVDHAFFAGFEWPFSRDAHTFARQAASEMQLVNAAMKLLHKQRQAGAGRLSRAKTLADLNGQHPFLDGFTYVVPNNPLQSYDLLVLGDLHGCYSCLKASLMQADFFGKVERYRANPTVEPKPYLILLGDYIDRGRFSYSGTLRAMMQLLVRMPEHVFALRGNHEHYVEINGKVVAPVRPCEAMDEISAVASNDVFVNYMHLFESLPTVLLFDQLFFVHGGIPRSDTLKERWRGLSTLNDAVVRFEMLWSDPSDIDVVPVELQQESARFAFGRQQFFDFMKQVGCHTMIRGHERVPAGYHNNYNTTQGMLLTLFSAGGENNLDLPEESNYREVTPAALRINIQNGMTDITPFYIDYAPYNQPTANSFHAIMPRKETSPQPVSQQQPQSQQPQQS